MAETIGVIMFLAVPQLVAMFNADPEVVRLTGGRADFMFALSV